MIGPSEEGPISDTEAKYKLQYIIKFKIENHRITAVLWPSAVLHLLPRLGEPPNRLQQQYEQSRTSSLVAISSTAFVIQLCSIPLLCRESLQCQYVSHNEIAYCNSVLHWEQDRLTLVLPASLNQNALTPNIPL